MKRDLPTLVIGASLALILMYFGVVGYLWRQGLFDIPDTESGARVLAAVLALLGGLFAALLTFAGVLLKHSIDERNLALQKEIADRLKLEGKRNLDLREEAEERLKLETKRNLDLKQDAEERLRLETFIHAAGLLATDAAGNAAPKTQQAAALFALAELKHFRFALALLREMWPAGDISPTSACWLIDKCLGSNDQKLQEEAAGILAENAETLTTAAECFDWPQAVTASWPSHLGQNAGFNILGALFRCLCSRPAADWGVTCLNDVILTLAEVRATEKGPSVRGNATLLVNVLLGMVMLEEAGIKLSGGGRLDLTQLASDIDLAEAENEASVQGLEMANKLKEWAKGAEPEGSGSGPPDP